MEQKLEAVVIDDPQNAEKLIAEEVTKSKFDNLKVAVGVLLANGKQPEVQYIESGDNRVYVYRSSDDITNISYVIRNLTQSQTYPVYPEELENIKLEVWFKMMVVKCICVWRAGGVINLPMS